MCQYGVPVRLNSDQGANLNSHVFWAYVDIWKLITQGPLLTILRVNTGGKIWPGP